jgi:P-type E1-E2 ATPase
MIQGKPSVEKIVAIEGFEEKVVLHYLFSLNQFSEHPLAAAVVKDGENKGVKAIELGHFEAISGMRVVGTIHSKKVALGNRKLTEKVETLIPKKLQGKVREEQDLGKTMSYLTIDQKVVGYVVVFDALKKSSKQAIADLIDHGMGVIMMTGDNKNTAQAVVKQLNLSDFQTECLPEDKLLKIKELQKAGKIIALAGDGINDAPALAQANVGIAMGTGTDVAIESAQVTSVKGDLNGILNAIKLSHAVMANIKQNLFFAFAYNSIGIPIAAGLLYPVFGWLLSPMIAAAAMSFSSVSVIANSLRLRKFKMKRSS